MIGLLVAALLSIFTWPTFGLMVLGVALAMIVGIIPGLGGYFLLAILIPFVYGMDPLPAIALILSAHAGLSSLLRASGFRG